MAEKIYDYSNKQSYNGVAPKENEALVPFLAHEVLKNYHHDVRDGFRKRNEGILEDNFETWNIRGRKILVGFVAIPKDQVTSYMEVFWKEKDEYLESTRKKRCLILNSKGEYIRCTKCNKCEGCERPEKDQYISQCISLDKFMDDNSDDDTNRSGWILVIRSLFFCIYNRYQVNPKGSFSVVINLLVSTLISRPVSINLFSDAKIKTYPEPNLPLNDRA